MSILYSFTLLISISCFVILGWRYYREAQLRDAATRSMEDQLFQRKLAVVQQKERRLHLLTVLGVLGGITAAVLLLSSMQWQVTTRQRATEAQLFELTQTVKQLSEEQEMLLNMPIYEYPKTGIELETFDWSAFLSQENPAERFEVEQELARQVTPFMGRATVIVTNNVPLQRLTLTFYSEVTAESKLERIQINSLLLLEEANQIEELSQVNFQIRQRGKDEPVFTEVYVRNEEGALVVVGPEGSLSPEEPEEKPERSRSSEDQMDSEETTTSSSDEEVEQKGAVKGNG